MLVAVVGAKDDRDLRRLAPEEEPPPPPDLCCVCAAAPAAAGVSAGAAMAAAAASAARVWRAASPRKERSAVLSGVLLAINEAPLLWWSAPGVDVA